MIQYEPGDKIGSQVLFTDTHRESLETRTVYGCYYCWDQNEGEKLHFWSNSPTSAGCKIPRCEQIVRNSGEHHMSHLGRPHVPDLD